MSTLPIAPRTRRDARPVLFFVTLVVVILDRLSKLWIVHNVPLGSALTVIPNLFRITHVENTGAAFSLLADSLTAGTVRILLVAFSAFALLIILAMLWRIGRSLTSTSLALALILGGALGNLYDRIHYSYVVDFLEVRIIHYHWPDFNLADSSIVLGACLLLLQIFRAPPAEA